MSKGSAEDASPLHIIRNDAAARFEAAVDGVACVLDYRLLRQAGGDAMAIDHVGVPAPVAGRGIAGALTRAALDAARTAGWRVIANCPYAAAWIERHPDYRNLLAVGADADDTAAT